MDAGIKQKILNKLANSDLESKLRAVSSGILGNVTAIPAGLGAYLGDLVGKQDQADNDSKLQHLNIKDNSNPYNLSPFEQAVIDDKSKQDKAEKDNNELTNLSMAAGFMVPGFKMAPAEKLASGLIKASESKNIPTILNKVLVNENPIIRKLNEILPFSADKLTEAEHLRANNIMNLPINDIQKSKLVKEMILENRGLKTVIRDVSTKFKK